MSDIGPGDLVLCVAGPRRPLTEWQQKNCPGDPQVGMIYTVRQVIFWEGDAGLLLREIVNPTLSDGWEIGFYLERFRKIEDRGERTKTSQREPVMA